MNRPSQIHKLATARRGGWLFRLVLAVVILAGLAYGVHAIRVRSAGAKKTASVAGNQFWKVQRGPLVISLLATGTVKAKNTTEIKCRVPGDVKIIWIVDEGTVVKKGEKLIELDSANLKEAVTREKIETATAQAAYDSAVEDLAIQESKNRSDLLKAQNALDLANLDMEKYIAANGDFQQKLRTATSDITVADAELKRASERYDWTKKLVEKNYVSRGELEADELALTKQKIGLDKANYDKQLLEKYEYKRQLSKLKTDVAETSEVLGQTRHSNESQLRTKKTAVESALAKLDLQKSQLAEKEQQLADCKIIAPQDGMVVYAQGRGPWDDSNRIQVGAQVRNQQKLIDLPDFSAWQIETRVHESRIQEVRLGQKAIATLDAFNGAALDAQVGKIGVLPESGNWFQPDTKEYIVNLELTTTTLPLKPGMSTKTELMLDRLENVVYVPLQAVSTVDGKTICMVKGELGPRPQEVTIGQNNDRFIEVRSGLKEGDTVVMQGDLGGDSDVIKRPSDEKGAGGKPGDKAGDKKGGKPGEKKDPKQPAAPAAPAGGAPAGGAAAPQAAAKEASAGQADKAGEVKKSEAEGDVAKPVAVAATEPAAEPAAKAEAKAEAPRAADKATTQTAAAGTTAATGAPKGGQS